MSPLKENSAEQNRTREFSYVRDAFSSCNSRRLIFHLSAHCSQARGDERPAASARAALLRVPAERYRQCVRRELEFERRVRGGRLGFGCGERVPPGASAARLPRLVVAAAALLLSRCVRLPVCSEMEVNSERAMYSTVQCTVFSTVRCS